jgi:hypothetical protein
MVSGTGIFTSYTGLKNMGMFDEFECSASCPVCGNPLEDFQTKDLECQLDIYCPGDLVDSRSLKWIRVYTTCVHYKELDELSGTAVYTKNHGLGIEYYIPIKHGRIVQDQNKWIRKIKHVDFNGLFCVDDGMTLPEVQNKIKEWNDKRAEDIWVTGIEEGHHERTE